MLDFADASVANEFAGAIELLPRALLRADLQDLLGGRDLIAHVTAFGDRQGRGLLQVDVFLRAHCVDGEDGVLMVGRADDDGVDVFVGEEFAIVVVAGDAVVGLAGLFGVVAVDEGLAQFNAVRVEIADRDDVGLIVLPDARQVVAARDAADADGAYVDAIARRGLSEDA